VAMVHTLKFTKQMIWNQSEHRRILNYIGEQIGIKHTFDWYNIKRSDLNRIEGCDLLLQYYDNSLPKALQKIYSEIDWELWKFTRIPKEFWRNNLQLRRFFDDAANRLNLKEQEDWYNINKEELEDKIIGANKILKYFGDCLCKALSKAYPDRIWHEWRFKRVPNGYIISRYYRIFIMKYLYNYYIKVLGARRKSEKIFRLDRKATRY
jgi:hypothetical protein